MNANKSHSRWLPATVLATTLLCILAAMEAPLPAMGWDGQAKGGAAAAQTASVAQAETLRMAGINLSQLDASGELTIDQSLGRGAKDYVLVTKKLQTRTEEVPYSTRYVGVEQAGAKPYVATAGQTGEKVVTYSLTLHDGIEISREKVGEQITRQPVDEVVCRGAGGELVIDGKTYSYSKVIQMRATAYTTENKTRKHTASGTVARVGAVAVDKNVIPLGTKLYIVASDGSWCYGVAVAEDTGVKGNTIDLFLNTRSECIYFGVRNATVYVLTD